MKIPLTGLRLAGLGLVAVVATQASARAQFDAQVTDFKWTQAVQTVPNTDLAAGKPTVVRGVCTVVNPPTDPVPLDGIMRVYVDGIEASFSPVFSHNGPYPASTAPVNLNEEEDLISFIFLPPESDDVVVEIEINPPGPNFVPEADTSNNTMSSGPRTFVARSVPELVYSPIDYTLGGGTPNPILIEPGAGDDVVQGIYGVPDWYYHRTDAPSKLWTSSLNSSGQGQVLNNSLLADLNLMVPKPDFIYGWVIGGLSYNGVAINIPGKAAIGNTQTFKHQRSFAHELGHLLGLQHNTSLTQYPGADVEESLLKNHGLGMIKPDTLNDIMVPGLNTNQAWISRSSFISTFKNGAFVPGPILSGPGLLVTGIWNTETGTVVLDNVLNLPEVRPTDPVPEAEANFVVEAYGDGQLLERLPLRADSAADSCADRPSGARAGGEDSVIPVTEVSVHFSLLSGADEIDRLVIEPLPGVDAGSVVLTRSAGRPEVQFISPLGDVSAGQVQVAWTGSDPDGDPLTYYLRYSRDGFHYSPLASGITATEWDVDVSELPAFEDGQGFFEVLASDGLNTTVARSAQLYGSGVLWAAGSNPPWVEIFTPDSGHDYFEGATVILHSSGWDLEDRALSGASITWDSSLDGPIGTGRLFSITTLSVGVHAITVTATDSDGLTDTDTHTVTIVARGLPDVGGIANYCTAGFSASGCQALLSATGTPSATAPSGFTVTAATVEGIKDGLYFYGTNGRQANPWGNGTSYQCVVPPTIRTPTLNSGGTLFACDGSVSRDMNAFWTANPIKNPGAGVQVNLQFWYRDPLSTSNQTTSLSDALEFELDP